MSKEVLIEMLIKYGGAALILIIGLIVIKIVLNIERRTLCKSKIDEALHTFIINGSKIAFLIILIVMILGKLDVNTASLVAVLGAGGAAIALALKDSLGNVAGGIIILINKPFIKGDTVEINGVVGKVDSIDLLTCKLHTLDNKVVTVPNGSITTSVLINYSQENLRRVDCTFGISYGADINKAKEILNKVAENCPGLVKDREPVVGVASQGDNAVMIDYFIWCETSEYYNAKYYMMENVKKAFDEAGIEIPFPQVDIHVIN